MVKRHVGTRTGSAELRDKVSWKKADRRTADDLLARGKVFGALVIPEDFSASVAALAGPPQHEPHPPTMTVLTNPAAGSFGSGMAAEINRKVVANTSAQVGRGLTQELRRQSAHHSASAHASRPAAPRAAAQLMIADPVKVNVEEGHPLGAHSGLGLSAYFYALVLVLGGMLGANVIHTQVDTALGYMANDKGPFRLVKPAQHMTRMHHFVVWSVLMVVLSMLTSALAMTGAVGVVGIDASHLGLLWIFGTCATAAMGITALVLIGLAIPSAGATIPLQALPDFYRFLAEFEPFRQVIDGIRSILYFGARTDAGLGRAWTMTAIGFAGSLLRGLVLTRLYDHRGLHRSALQLSDPQLQPGPRTVPA
ncbi:DUF3533 domain-containing protein [Streptomyces sp. NPDC056352]|uniref:YhgE/Pip domain-containing protein n=1 Tax=Streptomyces sp. NPDC056352 TaxID=3345791 RepID=UPI0035E27653